MSESLWNTEREQEKYRELWLNKPSSNLDHSANAWNERAGDWERKLTDEGIRKKRNEKRISETAQYLRSRGVLTPETEIIDIGCGPGRFVAEFAKTARLAAGTDISAKMLEFAADYAAKQGLENTRFIPCDFKQADIKDMGWEKAFDVVFSSITPAVSTPDAIDKVETMSRKYCFSANFIYTSAEIAEEAYSAVFPGEKKKKIWDGRSFYAMFNLLWLRGRYPEVRYYKEEEVAPRTVNDELISEIAWKTGGREISDAERLKLRDYLLTKADADGVVTYPSAHWYGWLLWDVNDKGDRDYA